MRAGDHLKQAQVGLPLVADHLAAGEAPDGDDHPLQPRGYVRQDHFGTLSSHRIILEAKKSCDESFSC